MKLWWLTNFARVGTEKAAVEHLAATEGWFALSNWRINAFRFSVDGIITAHGVEYPVRLIYPDQFPLVPAWVEPQDSDAKWSKHQYGKGGSLCLELRPDNWSPDASGADVLRSAYNLLHAENPLGDGEHNRVPSAHQIGDLQSYDWGTEPVLIGSGCLERICNGTSENVRALRWMADDSVWPILVFDAMDSSQPRHPPSFDLGTLRHELPVVIVRAAPLDPAPSDRAALASALNIELGSDLYQGALVAIVVNEKYATPFHSANAGSVFARKWVVLPDEPGARSGRAETAIGKSVAIVGLGSAGSKIAEILLRSGINNLVLIDGDVLLPVNLERHILDWRDVGFRKANAVKRRLLHITPGASIKVIATNLNWQRSAKTHADHVEALAACDMIVNATGDAPSSLLIGAIATENEKPFVSVEVFEGGLGALIARSLPGRDPPYVVGQAAYIAYCEQMKVEPPPSGHGTYDALTEAGTPIVADDAAVTIAAAHAARVILDILDSRVGPTDTAWLLFGCRNGWLFQRHGHTISLDVGSAPPRMEAIDDIEARVFVLALAKEAINATAPSI